MVRRSLNIIAIATIVAELAPAAAAAPGRVGGTAPPSGGAAGRGHAATVDWARGLVIADGLGIADRHAPSPAVARGTSRRAAEDAAKHELAAALPALPTAAGGTVGDKLGDAAIKARIDRAVDAAIAIAAEPETDGAWHVTLAVPIEAVRQALAGPRALGAVGDRGPAVVIVTGVKVKPAIGYKIGGHAAAVVWLGDKTEPPAWVKDAPRVVGTVGAAGAIELAAGSNATDATLFVVIGSS